MFDSLTLFGLVRLSCQQKLDPVLQTILGKDKHDAIKLFFGYALSLRFIPKLILERVAVGAVVVAVRPHHQRCITASVQTMF